MKYFFKLTVLVTLLTSTITSCKKDENKVLFEGGDAPVLTVVTTPAISPQLNQLNQNMVALKFNWTNPNYKFNTGVSSQDVTYTLQIDSTGSNFSNPKLIESQISKDFTTSFTVKELNTLLSGLGLRDSIIRSYDMRVKSTMANLSAPLYSNVYKTSLATYFDVVYPVPAALYITGEATPLNWQCGCATDGAGTTQKFTKVSPSKFELTVALNGGKSYLFLPVYGSWSAKYGFDGASNNDNNVNGDKFRPDGKDMKAPGSGTYKITVDFKTGKWSVQ
jgi:starch-binding outer membrane protein SusE/F